MKTVNFTEYQKKRQTFIKQRVKLNLKRVAARRVRDPEERELLIKLDKYRWQKWIRTGKLKKIADRTYVFS